MKRNKPLKRNTKKTAEWLSKPRKSMKRTAMKKVGKIGKANIKANKILKDVLADINYCEIQFNKDEKKPCLGNMYLTNAHRHKRAWYKGDVDLLSDKKQVVRACVNCHDTIEHNADLTEKVFIKLRGEE